MLNINWLGAIYMLIPIIIILLLLEKDIKRVKYISLGGSFVLLILSNLLWVGFDPLLIEYQYQIEFIKNNFFTFHVGIDGISLFFIILTIFYYQFVY